MIESIKKFIKEKNYWPHTIVGMISAVVVLCAWTISVALENPVQMSTKFMDKYQNVDNNINDILISNYNFQKLYRVEIDDSNFKVGDSKISLKVFKRDNNQIVDSAKVDILVTRAETVEFDKSFKEITYQDGTYSSDKFKLEKAGRWRVIYRVDIGEYSGFNELDYNGTSKLYRLMKRS